MRRPNWRSLVAVCAALSLVASACGGDDDDDEGASGQAGKLTAVAGFDPDKEVIKVGAISALTGAVAILGNPITEGGKVFFEALNAKGGIAGKYTVEVVVEDSAYDNNTGITKYEKIKNEVVMLNQLLGTGVTQAVLPKLKADKMVAAPASLDAEWQVEENLLPVGGPYQIEFINAANYYVNEGGGKGKNICLLAINIPYGTAGLEGLQAAAKAEGFDIKATARYEPTDQDFTAPVTQLKNAKCDAVFLTALPSNTGPILATAAKLGFTPQWFGQAPTFITAQAASAQLAPIMEKTFLLASEGPQWGDESSPGMKQMLADIKQFRPNQAPDFYFSFGYALAQVTAALLEKAVANGDLSRQGILDALGQLGTVDVGGLFGATTYGKVADRNPSRQTTIFKVNSKVPGALEAVKKMFTSPAAEAYSFKK
jgi:ABC-type branched-subunit amino acid transport system substrate-binding protein